MNPLSKGFAFGFAAGLAVGVALPVIIPAVAEVSRPVAKALLKHTLLGIARLKTSIARASESIEDFMAEVRSEVDRELAQQEPPIAARPDVATGVQDAPFTTAGAKVYS